MTGTQHAEAGLKPAMTLDMRGTSCPAPLLGAKRLVDSLRPGEVLLLLSDCPGTRDDLHAWSRHTDVEIAHTERLPGGGQGFHIRRGRTAKPSVNAILDLRGAVCPGPIVEAKRLLNGMQGGETLMLVSNCPGVAADVADWVRATGFSLDRTAEIAPGEFEFTIRKP
jgi:TusA-related sulfurtransferase